MKKLIVLTFLAALVAFSGSLASAQGKYGADSAECIKYLSYYQEYFKQKNYDSAIPNWRKAFNICPPTANQNMLLNGATLIRQLITKNANNAEYKAALIDTLLNIHEIRAQYYPKFAVTAINNKGLDIITYVKDDNKFIYEQLSKVVDRNGVETNPNLLVVLMNAAIGLYDSGDLDQDTILYEYEKAMSLLDDIGKAKPSEDIAKYSAPIENLFISSHVADCDKLVELFTPRLAADSESYETAATIVRILSITEGCMDNDLFVDAAATMHKLQPSNSSAYFMYRIYSSRGDIDNATAAMLQAISFDNVDNDQKADYYFELAANLVKNGNNAKAFEYAVKAAQLDTDNSVAGKAYMLCGTVWGSIVCPGNEIEARAPYWVATDYMVKAKSADPSLADECNKYISQYRQYFPQTADAFMYDVTDGESYTVSCGGMTANTTVKTQK